MIPISRLAVALFLTLPLCGVVFASKAQAVKVHDEGESSEYLALKARAKAPTKADMDATVSLDGLLARKGEHDWSMSKGGALEGYVVQVEKEQDGDFHLALAAKPGETSTANWVFVEASPAWRSRNASLADARLRALRGKKVHVDGWLLYESEGDDAGNDPRGSRWEIHPVTDVNVLK